MLANIAPTARLVLPRTLLLKATHHHAGMYAHGAGYAFYGTPARWHKITADKPAPKGAPVAAHPEAGGKHDPKAHFTDEQWQQLKLADTNVNAPSYNKALDKLKEWSDAGNVTAILGAQFGTNTYGQKLAKIANHLLEQHGSTHKVTPGQKPGTHAAIQAPAAAPTEAPQEAQPPASPQAPTPAPFDHGELNIPGKTNNINAELDKYKAKQAAEAKAEAKEKSAQKKSDKAEAKDLFAQHADAMVQKMTPGIAAKQGLSEKDAAKQIRETLLDMTKWQPAKFLALAKKFLKEQEAAVALAGDAPAQSAQSAPEQAAIPEPAPATPASPPPGVKKNLDNLFAEGNWEALQKLVDNGHPSSAPYAKELLAQKPAPEPAPQPAPEPAEASPSALAMPQFQEGKTTTGVKAYYEKQAQKIIDHATAGNVAVLEDMQSSGSQPNATTGKISNTWAGKTANSKMLLALYDQALAHAKGGAAAPAEAAAPAPAVASAAEPATAAVKVGSKAKELMKNIAPHGDKQHAKNEIIDALASGYKQKFVTKNADGQVTGAIAFGVNTSDVKGAVEVHHVGSLVPGGGSVLLAEAKKFAQEKGLPIKLFAHMDAVGFYKKQGFTQITGAPDGLMDWKPGAAAPAPAKPTGMIKEYPGVDGTTVSIGHGPDGKFTVAVKDNATGEFYPGGISYPTMAWAESAAMNVAAGKNAGPEPQEGDTKQGADGMLVFKDGHWHKVPEAAAAQEPQAAAPEPAAAPTGVDAVEVPDFVAMDSTVWGQRYAKVAEALKAAVQANGAAGLKGMVTNHADGTFTINAAGFKLKKISGSSAGVHPAHAARRVAMHKFVTELKAAAGKPAKKKAAPKAAATPAAAPASAAGTPPSMDDWVQVGGQGGSNPGGKFKDPSGQEWYCKFPGDADTAKSEILAAKLYGLAGLSGQDAQLVTKGGKIGIATKWVSIKKASSAAELAKVPGVLDGFAVDAWLGNWDVIGLSLDNTQIGPDGKAHRVDAGGSLEYRAQGDKKPFGNKVEELATLLDPKTNPKSAAVFGGMTEADITASVAKVLKISDVAIRAMVNQFGPGDAVAKAKLADTLIARKKDLAAKYPAADKAKKQHKFDPAKISAPPSFVNWGGSGKSGPSSKEFINLANEAAVQSIYQAAQTGDMDAVKNLEAPTYNKDTGQQVGSAKVLEHPSQHVKGYAQQAINEINYQLNPPKRFRFEGGHPLAALHSAYPAHPGGVTSQSSQKLAKYILLGEPGTVKLEDLALPPKITHTSAGGTLSTSTYAAAAKAAFAKMPTTQRQAIQSYTGSGYHQINGSLWSGNANGAAKAAGEALKTLGHDIAPGTVLSRKISLHGADLEALLKSTGKIIEEPAIMSTSIRPSSWSGNIQFKLHTGPGVKGLWVGKGSDPSGGAISMHSGEDEMILPPGTRMLIVSVKKGADADGFGAGGMHVIEAVILPTM